MGSLKQNLANNILSGGKFDATDLSGTVPASNVNNDSLTNLTTFSPSLGDTIKSVASDPSPATEGDFWYNTTTGALKGYAQIKAWSSGGNMGTARFGLTGAGTQTAGLGLGGFDTAVTNVTEEYSGYTWAAGGNLGTARAYLAGCGTQTAALATGGQTPSISSATEEYDGSAWTAGGSLGTARYKLGNFGIQTSGVAIGGGTTPTNVTAATEEYDGSAWTSGGSLNTARRYVAGFGTQTSAIAAGGATPGSNYISETESYNGSTWTVVSGNLNTARRSIGGGNQTSAIIFGGLAAPGASSATEEWDGSSWTTSPATMATARFALGAAGISSAGLGFGGYTTSNTAVTEEYNSNLFSPQTSTWSSGTNLPGNRYDHAGAGDQNATVIWSGAISNGTVYTSTSLEYDGSTWTSGGNQLYDTILLQAGAGTQTSALGMGGRAYPPYVPSSVATDVTQEYDGSTWTAGGNLNVARWKPSSAGIQTAALCFTGGGGPGPLSTSEAYDGTSWTTTSPTNIAVGNGAGGGLQTSAIRCGGLVTTTYQSTSEEYDGSVWTSTSPINEARYDLQVGATNSDLAWNSGGYNSTPSTVATTEEWDGTGWSTTSPMAQVRGNFNGTGPGDSGIVTGGFSGGSIITVEEYSRGNTTVTASTITTS